MSAMTQPKHIDESDLTTDLSLVARTKGGVLLSGTVKFGRHVGSGAFAITFSDEVDRVFAVAYLDATSIPETIACLQRHLAENETVGRA